MADLTVTLVDSTIRSATVGIGSLPIGTASANRRVVLFYLARVQQTGGTIGGVNYTVHQSIQHTASMGGFTYWMTVASAVVPTGTTVQFIPSDTGGQMYSLCVYSVTGDASTLHDSAGAALSDTDLAIPFSIDAPSNGVVIGHVAHLNTVSNVSHVWTGLTESLDTRTLLGAFRDSAAISDNPTPGTLNATATADVASTQNLHWVAVSFAGPSSGYTLTAEGGSTTITGSNVKLSTGDPYQDALSNFLGTLENAGVTENLDALYVLAAPEEEQALVDHIGSYDLTRVNSPQFVPNLGFRGDLAEQRYLDTGFNPAGLLVQKLVDASDGTAQNTLTSTSFTPADDSLLVVVATALLMNDVEENDPRAGPPSISDSLGSLTWTNHIDDWATQGWASMVAVWSAPIVAGESMTVTVDYNQYFPNVNSGRNFVVYQVRNHDPDQPIRQIFTDKGIAGRSGTYTGQFSQVPLSGSVIIAAAGADEGTITGGDGWTTSQDFHSGFYDSVHQFRGAEGNEIEFDTFDVAEYSWIVGAIEIAPAPEMVGTKFSQDDASMTIYVMEEGPSVESRAGFYDGTGGVTIGVRVAGTDPDYNCQYRVNSATASVSGATFDSSIGQWTVMRHSPTQQTMSHNGVQFSVSNQNSVPPKNGNLRILGQSNTSIDNHLIGMAAIGNLTQEQDLALYNAFQTYLAESQFRTLVAEPGHVEITGTGPSFIVTKGGIPLRVELINADRTPDSGNGAQDSVEIPLGDPADSRRIVVVCLSAAEMLTATLNGVDGVRHENHVFPGIYNPIRVSLWSFIVPSGTTGTLAWTSGEIPGNFETQNVWVHGIWAIKGNASAYSSSGGQALTSTGVLNWTIPLMPENSVAIGHVGINNTEVFTQNVTWTGLNEDFDNEHNGDANTTSGASRVNAVNPLVDLPVTVTPDPLDISQYLHYVWGVWSGPPLNKLVVDQTGDLTITESDTTLFQIDRRLIHTETQNYLVNVNPAILASHIRVSLQSGTIDITGFEVFGQFVYGLTGAPGTITITVPEVTLRPETARDRYPYRFSSDINQGLPYKGLNNYVYNVSGTDE